VAAAIMIMEDDEAVRDAMQRILVRLGHPIVTVATAAEAVESCGREVPALVIADLSLAGSGFVQRLSGSPSIIFVSGLTRSAASRRGLLEDGDVLVSKPFTSASLRSAVAAALGG
jgi:DNA-binding response OmpR family regulator